MSLFNNTASNSDYGLYSYYYNSNFSYYSNTFINDSYSLYSEYDYLGYIYANTFLDTQANAPAALHFLYLDEPYGTLTFYHNNFLNETTNSIVQNYYYNPDNYPVYMNAPLPTGGNYWSNYTGSGYNGIGTTPMPVNGSLMDYYPLTSRWISPTVTFMETGLPAGTSWSVSLGSTMYSSAGGSIVFSPTKRTVHERIIFCIARIRICCIGSFRNSLSEWNEQDRDSIVHPLHICSHVH